MIIDTHCHYNLEPLFATKTGERQVWRQHWQNAKNKGVVASLVVGTNLNTSSRAITISGQDPNLFASIGIHPSEIVEFGHELYSQDWINQKIAEFSETLSILAKKSPKIIAIGETGLDYFRLPEDQKLSHFIIDGQKKLLIMQLKLASQNKLPVILHVRDKNYPEEITQGNAYWDVLKIIDEYLSPNHPFILHCVSGPVNYIKTALIKNCYLGVAGNVTYSSANQIRKIVGSAPKNRILLETDAPYLPPQSNRGKICEPMMIAETSAYLESELGLNQPQIIKNTKLVLPQLAS